MKTLEPIGLLALDLDDTLLNHDLQISRENHDALVEAEARGVRVVLASGRGPYAMRSFVTYLEMDRREGYAVTFNGALVRRTDTGEVIFSESLAADLAEDAMAWAVERNLPVQTYRDDTIYVTFETEYTSLDARLTHMKLGVASPRQILDWRPVKYVIPGDPEELAEREVELRAYLGNRANVFRSKPFFLEVMAPGADKAHGLRALAEHLGVDRQEVMAIGDAGNDAGMLGWAGLPVAMANAIPEVKQLARWVTTRDNDNAGVAEAVRRFILGE